MPKLREGVAYKDSEMSLSKVVHDWMKDCDPAAVYATCLTCKHCSVETAVCNKFKRVPPVAVIVGSIPCRDYWDSHDIPF